MALGRKTLLEEQVDVFIDWTTRHGTGTSSYREWLDLFVRHTERKNVEDIELLDVDLFLEKVQNIARTQFTQQLARKALLSFRKFYMARSRNGNSKLGRGRPAAIDQYYKVGEYKTKNQGLTYKEIGILLNPRKPVHKDLVFQWFQKFKEMTGMEK